MACMCLLARQAESSFSVLVKNGKCDTLVTHAEDKCSSLRYPPSPSHTHTHKTPPPLHFLSIVRLCILCTFLTGQTSFVTDTHTHQSINGARVNVPYFSLVESHRRPCHLSFVVHSVEVIMRVTGFVTQAATLELSECVTLRHGVDDSFVGICRGVLGKVTWVRAAAAAALHTP